MTKRNIRMEANKRELAIAVQRLLDSELLHLCDRVTVNKIQSDAILLQIETRESALSEINARIQENANAILLELLRAAFSNPDIPARSLNNILSALKD